jgi:Ca-activated chloride channel homolog
MSFANSWVFLFYLIIPLAIFLAFSKKQKNSLPIFLANQSEKLGKLSDLIGYYTPFLLRLLVISFVIFALARPQFGKSFTSDKHMGLDILLAVDTSQSMSALDMSLDNQIVDRLAVVKKISESFVLKRTKDRLGLLVFGEEAFTQCPLTTDQGAIIDILNHVEIGMAGNSTAIGSAIALGIKRIKDLESKSKILILMTDGQNTSGTISPLTAADLSKEYGIKIYTIGIGEDGEVPFEIMTPFGKKIIKQETAIDEETLIEIAEKTGGQYFRAHSSNELKQIYEHIDKLEKTEIEIKEYNSYKDIYEIFLWIAFCLFSLEILLANTILFRVY